MQLSEDLIDDIIDKLKGIDLQKIVLFGSYLYGEPDKNSDIDLLIIKDNVKSKLKESIEARKRLNGLKRAFDISVVSEREYNFYKNEAGSLYKTVNERGVVIYG